MRRRAGGRGTDELRDVVIAPAYLDFAEGSALITWGRTRVLCAATVLEKLPPFRQESGGGWITAEYSMLPRATDTRQGRRRPDREDSGPHLRDPAPYRPVFKGGGGP